MRYEVPCRIIESPSLIVVHNVADHCCQVEDGGTVVILIPFLYNGKASIALVQLDR